MYVHGESSCHFCTYKTRFRGQFWSTKVGCGQFEIDQQKCEKIRGQKKWAFGQFWPVKVGRKSGFVRTKNRVFLPFLGRFWAILALFIKFCTYKSGFLVNWSLFSSLLKIFE